MYLGTAEGVRVLVEDDGRWREERLTLPGKEAHTLVASDEAGVVFAGIPGDGVYASSDGGQSWDCSLAGDVRALEVDPRHPATIYAGTEPVHLYRSTDAGDSWAEVEGLQHMPLAVRENWWFPNFPHDGHVFSIYVDHRDARHLYLGLEHGGIVRTEDGGTSWEDLSDGIEYIDIHSVVGDPLQQNVVYATTARGFYASENFGRDWALSIDGVTRDYMHSCMARPGAQSTLLMATANGSPPSWLRDTGAEAAIYRSTDTGLSWQQLRGGLPESCTRMVCGLVGDPRDEARLYAGISDHETYARQGATVGGEVWMTPDGGDTWSLVYETATPFQKLCVALV
jgi:photosystem II stability/assembly factor-like uncharacterized protein